MRFIFSLFFCLSISTSFSQVQWAYHAEGAVNAAGAPNCGLKPGSNKYASEPSHESTTESEDTPVPVHLHYQPMKAAQVIVVENHNPGSITKIEIGNKAQNKRQVVYTAVAEKTAEPYHVLHALFPLTDFDVTDVWLTCAITKVEGSNQIDAVGISAAAEPYQPTIKLPHSPLFAGNATEVKLYYRKKHAYTASTPVITQDGSKLYFSSNLANVFHNEELFESTLRKDSASLYELSKYNLPGETSTATGLIAALPDNKTVVVSNMSFPRPTFYRCAINNAGKVEWTAFKIEDYRNDRGAHQYEIMSSNEKMMIIAQTRDGNKEIKTKQDLYVCFANGKGNYGAPINMGNVLNTIGNEIPSYLSDNCDTLFFSSDGHIGYGGRDLFYSLRLDSSYTNWSEPINLGEAVNSYDKEMYFTITPKQGFAYFTRSGRIMRLKLRHGKTEELAVKKTDTAAPLKITPKSDVLVLVKGFVLNKTNDKPIAAEITCENLLTHERAAFTVSDSVSGEFEIAITGGASYSLRASAEDFITVSENINVENQLENIEIERNLYMVPFLIGQVVRLNNIFFETAKAELLPESNLELDKLFVFLKNNPSLVIEIAGHTDNQGDERSNQTLSENRAIAVMNYIVEKGIAAGRISAVGYGENKPETTNETEEGRMRNRRVEFKIISQ